MKNIKSMLPEEIRDELKEMGQPAFRTRCPISQKVSDSD